MAKIAFLLLCHQNPDQIIAQAKRLTATGDYIAIHYDARAGQAKFREIKEALKGNENVAFASRIKCGWGEWSLVKGTLNALMTAEDAFPKATHFYLISGDCMPIKSSAFARKKLDAKNVDYIESVDFYKSGWIKTGMKEDRLRYRHFFNERKNKGLFYTALNLQRRLGLTRTVPADLEMMIGSQWWCLRRATIEKILRFCRSNRRVLRFFSTTWIPDETFFQTLVRHLIPREEIDGHNPTFLMFTDYGLPATFYNDHYEMLISQDFLFARKISPEAQELKAGLGKLWASGQQEFPAAGDGKSLFTFLTQRGRVGRRFAPRFWEKNAALGRERSLYILVCKKWHVAKRMARQAENSLGIKSLNYLFDEIEPGLVELGGIESNTLKRNRHRRAVIRMLYDMYDTNRLLFCADPGQHQMIREFYGDSANVRTLYIDCTFQDAYLAGHAKRIGLATEDTSDQAITQILPTLRYDIQFEADQVRDSDHSQIYQIGQEMSEEARRDVLRAFFACDNDAADAIAKTPYLFED